MGGGRVLECANHPGATPPTRTPPPTGDGPKAKPIGSKALEPRDLESLGPVGGAGGRASQSGPDGQGSSTNDELDK